MKYIIIKGDPNSGFEYQGVFNDTLEAIEWAETYLVAQDWWMSEIKIVKDS